MSDLRDSIRTAIESTLSMDIEIVTPAIKEAQVAAAADAVWNVLSDRIGAVQEKLLNDLDMVRTERDALRRREDVLVEQVRVLGARLAQYEPVVET